MGVVHGDGRSLHHLPSSGEGMLETIRSEDNEDCASPTLGGVGGIGGGCEGTNHSITAIRATGIRVMRESPSSSGDYTAKLNQIPVSPYQSNQYLLSVPHNEPV